MARHCSRDLSQQGPVQTHRGARPALLSAATLQQSLLFSGLPSLAPVHRAFRHLLLLS